MRSQSHQGETTWYEKDGHHIGVDPDGEWAHYKPDEGSAVDHGKTPLSLVAQQVGEAKPNLGPVWGPGKAEGGAQAPSTRRLASR